METVEDDKINIVRIFLFENGADWNKILETFYLKGYFIASLEGKKGATTSASKISHSIVVDPVCK